MSVNIGNLTIKKAGEMMRGGSLTSTELVSACLKNIEAGNKELNVFLEVFSAKGGSALGGDDALEQAAEADMIIKSGKAAPLTGIPLAIKDNILIKGRKCSAASKILENYVASYDATVIKKLREQGAVFIGRTNMDEFAMGSSTENSAFGPTKNPLDPARVPGGSSGGSAASVAAGMALGALGSDTGGSIRQPAAFCGLVGFKPTYGAVSRFGLIAMGSSLDVIGPIAKTVEDVRIIFEAIVGEDPLDATSMERGTIGERSGKSNSFRIGVPRAWLEDKGLGGEIREDFEKSLEKMKRAGAEIMDVDLPLARVSLSAYYILMPAEASTNLARYDGMRYGMSREAPDLVSIYKKTRGGGFGREVRRRVMLGTYVLSHGYYDAYYNRAAAAREQIKIEFNEAFKKIDLIVTPTTPTPAFKIGEKIEDPVQMYLSDIFTVPANIAGLPAISIPSRMNKEGLPLGIQFTAPLFKENLLFAVDKIYD